MGLIRREKNRFMPPQKPEPWTDVRPAVLWEYGAATYGEPVAQ